VKPISDVTISVGKTPEPEPEPPQPPAPEETPAKPDESASAAEPSTLKPVAPQVTKTETKPEMKPKPDSEPALAAKSAKKTVEKPEASAQKKPRSFSGRVTVSGEVPKLPALLKEGAPTKDAICAKETIPNESILTSEDSGLANVFVYLKKAPKGDLPEPSESLPVLDQMGCRFTPYAQIIHVKNPLRLKNSDPVAHNVRINGFVSSFNQTFPSNDQTGAEFTFKGAEKLPAGVKCDFHGWMAAWVLPLDHPFGAVTDENGHFEITNLPDGEHEFTIWHERVGYIERKFKVKIDSTSVVENNFTVSGSDLTK